MTIEFPLVFPSQTALRMHWARIERFRQNEKLFNDNIITWHEARKIIEARDAEAGEESR